MIKHVAKSAGIALFELLISLPLGIYFILALTEIGNFIHQKNEVTNATYSAAKFIRTAFPNKKIPNSNGSLDTSIDQQLERILFVPEFSRRCAAVVTSQNPQSNCSIVSASRRANNIRNNKPYSVKIEIQKTYSPLVKGLGFSLPNNLSSTLIVEVPPDRSLPPEDCPDGQVLIFDGELGDFTCGLQFGGMFQRYLCDTSNNYALTGVDCIQPNPVTKDCSCPKGFTPVHVLDHYEPASFCSDPKKCKNSCYNTAPKVGWVVDPQCSKGTRDISANGKITYWIRTCPQDVYNSRGMIMFLCQRTG